MLSLLSILQKEAKHERKRVAERKIQSAVGFRRVIDLLSSEKKLIVGHNCFLGMRASCVFRRLWSFCNLKMHCSNRFSFYLTQMLHMYTANLLVLFPQQLRNLSTPSTTTFLTLLTPKYSWTWTQCCIRGWRSPVHHYPPRSLPCVHKSREALTRFLRSESRLTSK